MISSSSSNWRVTKFPTAVNPRRRHRVLRLGTWNDEPNDADVYKYERLEDMVHVTSTAFLALTVKCARCHDHKFDPNPSDRLLPHGRRILARRHRTARPRTAGWPYKKKNLVTTSWAGLTSRQPPPLHLLKKGEHKHPFGHRRTRTLVCHRVTRSRIRAAAVGSPDNSIDADNWPNGLRPTRTR
jgi:hypothetical protein